MEKNIRRRPTKIQATHREHSRVRLQGFVIGERASPPNPRDEALAIGAHLRENEGDVGAELIDVCIQPSEESKDAGAP